MRRGAMLLATAALLMAVGCGGEAGGEADGERVEIIDMDFPHGETRLQIRRSGEALLYYGALPQHEVVKPGVFDIDKLHKDLLPRLHPNLPREEWPDPKAKAGMVNIRYADGTDKSFLIYDGDFAGSVFRKAQTNIVGSRRM